MAADQIKNTGRRKLIFNFPAQLFAPTLKPATGEEQLEIDAHKPLAEAAEHLFLRRLAKLDQSTQAKPWIFVLLWESEGKARICPSRATAANLCARDGDRIIAGDLVPMFRLYEERKGIMDDVKIIGLRPHAFPHDLGVTEKIQLSLKEMDASGHLPALILLAALRFKEDLWCAQALIVARRAGEPQEWARDLWWRLTDDQRSKLSASGGAEPCSEQTPDDEGRRDCSHILPLRPAPLQGPQPKQDRAPAKTPTPSGSRGFSVPFEAPMPGSSAGEHKPSQRAERRRAVVTLQPKELGEIADELTGALAPMKDARDRVMHMLNIEPSSVPDGGGWLMLLKWIHTGGHRELGAGSRSVLKLVRAALTLVPANETLKKRKQKLNDACRGSPRGQGTRSAALAHADERNKKLHSGRS